MAMTLEQVSPQPTYIESSGRWEWPLPEHAQFEGCCKSVVTASREWWEYTPSEARPHPMAEGVQLRNGKWYWAIPASDQAHLSAQAKVRVTDEDLPPLPRPHHAAVYANSKNTRAVAEGYEMGGYEKEPPYYTEAQMKAYALAAIEANPAERAAVPDGVLEAMDRACDVMAEAYAKYQLRLGPFASQLQKSNTIIRLAKNMLTAAPQPPEGARVVHDRIRSAARKIRGSIIRRLEGFHESFPAHWCGYLDDALGAAEVIADELDKFAAPTLAGKEGA